MIKKKIKEKTDRYLRLADSSGKGVDTANGEYWADEMVITGNLDLGQKGNPVTIYVEDEVTGEAFEMNGVREAFLVVADDRKNTQGWLALAVGGLDRLGEVLQFLSQMTIASLKKLAKH